MDWMEQPMKLVLNSDGGNYVGETVVVVVQHPLMYRMKLRFGLEEM